MASMPLAGQDQRMPSHLLIVDDSEPVRTSLRALLGIAAGIASIREAATLGQALDSARQDPPTLVILDMSLPDGLGMDIIEALRRLAPNALIAVHTIHAHDAFRQRCLALGADWFFDKCTDTDALLQVVRQHAALNPLIHSCQGTHDE
jgi:DNA-binding NarL/FixJ family response regulator